MSDNASIVTTGFEIISLDIFLKNGQEISLKGLYQEINLYDSVFSHCLTGNILITDSIGLINNLQFDGQEGILIRIGKTKEEIIFQQSYRIHKLSNRKNINQNSEMYVLHFISDEYIFSAQQRVHQVFTNSTYTQMVVQLLANYLGVDKMVLHDSEGLHTKQMPNMTPLDTVAWISKRALDKNKSPSFLFFQNRYGYNFVSLNELVKNNPIRVTFDPKNLGESENFNEEFYGARYMSVINQYDVVDSIESGVYASTLTGFDPITRTIKTKNLTFSDHYKENNHLNENSNQVEFNNQKDISRIAKTNLKSYDSRQLLYPASYDRGTSKYIQNNDKTSINYAENPDYLLKRKAIMKNLMTKRVRVVVPGNFRFTTGQTVLLNLPERQEQTSDNKDESLFGNYLIIGARHIITYNKHETVFDAVTDSNSADPKKYSHSSSAVTEKIAQFTI
jgi:hypothetical protein